MTFKAAFFDMDGLSWIPNHNGIFLSKRFVRDMGMHGMTMIKEFVLVGRFLALVNTLRKCALTT